MTAYSFVDQKVEIVLLLAVDRGGGGKGEGVLGGERSESKYFKWRDDDW